MMPRAKLTQHQEKAQEITQTSLVAWARTTKAIRLCGSDSNHQTLSPPTLSFSNTGERAKIIKHS